MLQQYLTDAAKKPYLHSNSGDRTWYITMNWAAPPFDDIHVRKAANWVMDKAGHPAGLGRVHLRRDRHPQHPADRARRPAAASDYNPYPSEGNRGDEAKAKEEMKQSKYDTQQGRGLRRQGMLQPGHDQPQHRRPSTDSEAVVVSSLEKIGIKVKPRELASSAAYTTIQTVKNLIPIALNAGWGKDYADPVRLRRGRCSTPARSSRPATPTTRCWA